VCFYSGKNSAPDFRLDIFLIQVDSSGLPRNTEVAAIQEYIQSDLLIWCSHIINNSPSLILT